MPSFQRSSLSFSQEISAESQQLSGQAQRGSLASSQSQSSYRFSSNGTAAGRMSTAGGAQDSTTLGEDNISHPAKSFLKRILCCFGGGVGNDSGGNRGCISPSSKTAHRCRRIVRSRTWKFMMIFFYFFVLFGSQVQHLWAPADDIAYNVLALITFGFCLIEMILRFLSEPNYFQFDFATCGANSNLNNKFGYASGGEGSNKDSTCAMGSFLFWCDLFSTGVTLFDISWINSMQYDTRTFPIQLDQSGFPVEGFDLQRLRPVNTEFALLVTIARCGRMARFVRSRTVVNASNQINWYWLFKHIKWCNPFFYYKRIRKQQRQAHLEALGAVDESTAFIQNTRENKRTSWGVLQIGILAAVRAQAEAEAREARDAKMPGWRFWNNIKRSFGSIGFSGNENQNQLRQLAAMRIQRVWRDHTRFEAINSTDGGSALGDLAFEDDSNTFMNSHRSTPINPLERVQGKRSALSAFARMNAQAGGKLDRREIKASQDRSSLNDHAPGSRFQSQAGKGRESQVGSDMRELTGQRVVVGVLLALIFTVVFTYTESNSTRPTTMVVLHTQTMNEQFRMDALSTARNTTTPNMYLYKPVNANEIDLPLEGEEQLRPRERIRYIVTDAQGHNSAAEFSFRYERVQEALTEIAATFFILLVWFFGVNAFAGPIMSLVVVPIERMVRLLGMLMMDPLGYQSTQKFKSFLLEEDDLIKNTRWTREVLKGMETSFLMSTILRIGSLMKVGFGSAGVEIIRNNLQKGQSKNMLILTTQGSTVSCIFLFCDIRQFTDATECLQEEVFVFTNRIAAVVHSICHSYGGAANKNVGDAFLLSWSLEDMATKGKYGAGADSSAPRTREDSPLKAKNNQADKALLSVIKMCISLYYDHYYLEPLSETAKTKLEEKLKKRAGPVVQMGFGLHAGKAVQGAIGSQRKIDATYVSEAVERAEFLESSTKKYELKMLMSGSFHRLLHPNTRRRCRKIDRILLRDEEADEDEDDDEVHGELMELFTFDMDVAAIHRPQSRGRTSDAETFSDSGSNLGDSTRRLRKADRRSHGSTRQLRNRRRSVTLRPQAVPNGSEELVLPATGGTDRGTASLVGGTAGGSIQSGEDLNGPNYQGPPELVLPTGPALYSHNVWQSPDMKRIRDKYVQGLFFQKFQAGLQAFYTKDWDMAKQCFQTVLDNFDDGPSKYFMEQIKGYNGVPPKDFLEYGLG